MNTIYSAVIILCMFAVAAAVGALYWYRSGSVAQTEPPVMSADAVPDGAAAARIYLAEHLNVGEGEVIILETRERDWPDACLGLSAVDEMCAQVITPGYEVILQYRDMVIRYRTSADGSLVRPESGH